jgi:maleamate amidohydrolase
MSASQDDVFVRQGFGGRLGLSGRPGLLLVDFVNGFADPAVLGGGNIGPAIRATVPVLAEARRRGWPVAYSRIVFAADGSDANLFTRKVPRLLALTEDAPAAAIVPELAPREGELVIRKTAPSAFRGTPSLEGWLKARQVESLAVAGCTTSGCVRASVMDAMDAGIRPLVLSDCVGDRALEPHQASLFDIAQKYGDVLTAAELLP